MKNGVLSREVYDSRNIRVVCGFGDMGNSGSDDTDSMASPDRGYNTDNQNDDDESGENNGQTINEETAKHQTVWSPEYEGKPRVISHGDLKFDLEDRVVAVLPLYLCDGNLVPMKAITGKIVDITSIRVNGKDVPREVKLRSSPDASKLQPKAAWANNLTIKDWKDEHNRVQTMVTSYKILLDQPFRLNQEKINILYKSAQEMLKLPYRYSTQLLFSSDEPVVKKKGKKKKRSKVLTQRLFEYITVSYRYIMGLESSCKKHLASIKRCDPFNITIEDIQEVVSRSKLSSGVFVQYVDSDSESSKNDVLNFVVLDHICSAPYDIRLVVRCFDRTNRILAISKISSFDVRQSYDIDDYHCFHPMDRYDYTIVNPSDQHFNQQNSIREAIHAIFDPIEVYIVKKSLCNLADIEYNVVEDNNGHVRFIALEKTSSVQPTDTRYAGSTHAKAPYRYTGISIASYVRGLAYPEGNCPTQHDLYTFFNSKDYYEIDLNPDSPSFLELICTSSSHSLFRNPMGRDVILAVPFLCDRDHHKGKTNLRWFYPSDEIRLLHLYVKTDGNHAQFKISASKKGTAMDQTSYIRSMFTGATLCIIDLLLFGLSKNNPTLKSKFTRRFMSRHFWWEKLNLELQQDANFDHLDE